MCLNMTDEGKGRQAMGNNRMRREAEGECACPVCGRRLPDARELRRCPSCGARLLWRRTRPHLSLGIVLFNARLCGIVIGTEIGMTALLLLGYRLPLPYGVMLGAAALPVIAYLLAGAIAQKLLPEARRGYLLLLMSVAAGLLVALIAATLGISGASPLLTIAALAGVLSSRLISRHVPFKDDA